MPITGEAMMKEHIPPLPGTGILFSSADGDTRFLALAPEAVPSGDYLRSKKITELAALIHLAQPLMR